MTSSLYDSKANGQAESAVKTCKHIMRKCIDSGSDPFLAVLDHRNSVTGTAVQPGTALEEPEDHYIATDRDSSTATTDCRCATHER